MIPITYIEATFSNEVLIALIYSWISSVYKQLQVKACIYT